MQKYKYKIREKNDYRIYKYTVHKIHCAKSSQKMSNIQIQYSAQNTKYEKQNTQCKKYLVQSYHRKCLKYKALLQYSTMCKSTREKKVKLWPLLHSCRLSIIRSFQSICIHSVFLVLCIFVLSICIFNPSVFFLYSIICVCIGVLHSCKLSIICCSF